MHLKTKAIISTFVVPGLAGVILIVGLFFLANWMVQPKFKGYLYLMEPTPQLRAELSSISRDNKVLRTGPPLITIANGRVDLEGRFIGLVQDLLKDENLEIAELSKLLFTIKNNYEILHADRSWPGEVVLRAQKQVQFEIVKKIVFTCTAAGFHKVTELVLLGGEPCGAEHKVNCVDRVSLSGQELVRPDGFGEPKLVVVIGEQGLVVVLNNNIIEWDLPESKTRINWAKLGEKLSDVHALFPEKDDLTIMSEDSVWYWDVIRAVYISLNNGFSSISLSGVVGKIDMISQVKRL